MRVLVVFGLVILLAVALRGPVTAQHSMYTQSDLLLVATDGSGEEYRLTDTAMREGEAAWSPDGSRVAFSGMAGGMSDVFVVNIDGSGLVNITNTPEVGEYTVSWSPDSRRIAFSAGVYTEHQREGSRVRTRSVDVTNINIMNADGSGRRQLTYEESQNRSPKFSPDGRFIAFVSGRLGLPEIFVMDTNGSNVRRVTHSPEGTYCQSPSWSPTGAQIAYTRHERGKQRGLNGNSDVYITNVDGSRTIQLTDTPQFERDPAWSPSGAWIAYCMPINHIQQIYCVQPNGQNELRITFNEDAPYTGPAWSPDERFMVVQTRRKPEKSKLLSTFMLWDSGGLGVGGGGDDTPRFLRATKDSDGNVVTHPLSEADARAWFVRHNIPFPELPDDD